jgi:ABC-type multidrug transport system fused ATPase/permease subunit
LIAASLIIFVTVKMGVKGRILRKAYNELDNKFGARRADYLSNIRTIITLSLGQQTAQDLDKRLSELEVADTRDTNWQNWRWFSEGMLINMLTAGCTAYMLWRLSNGSATFRIGDLVIIFNYLRQMSSSFSGFGFFYNSLSRRLTDYEGIRYIEDAPLPTSHAAQAVDTWTTVSIRDLSFTHGTSERAHLDRLSFDVQRGQKIALVGASGAGKSTLLTVLRGLYQTATGHVAIDSAPATDLSVLNSLSTLIPQEPEIFENSIRFNITLGMDYPDDEVMEACRLACFDTVLERLPNGLDSDIREKGVNLSGGQKQRLALARGIFAIRNSSLVLFDEPTSSVDSITERRIYQNLLTAFPDICLISSIHRLHMLPLFDQVIVMDHGQIVQHGPVGQVIEESGLLRDLVTAYHGVAETDLDDI